MGVSNAPPVDLLKVETPRARGHYEVSGGRGQITAYMTTCVGAGLNSRDRIKWSRL